jgi:PKD repeat protein
MTDLRRTALFVTLCGLVATLVVVAGPAPHSVATDDPPPVLNACPATPLAEWYTTSNSRTGIVTPITANIYDEQVRGLRRGCAFQGEQLSYWTCVPGGCLWQGDSLIPSVPASASPAVVPVLGSSRLVTFSVGGYAPALWPQCLPVGAAPECGVSVGGAALLVRFRNAQGDFSGEWISTTTSTAALPSPVLLVRQGTCEGGFITWHTGQQIAVGAPTCTYEARWNTDAIGRPTLANDVQVLVSTTWGRVGSGANYVGMPSTELYGTGWTTIPFALDANPKGVPTASMADPVLGDPGHFEFASTSTDSLGEVLTETWDFGDPDSGAANTATGPLASHAFTRPGTYTVTLTVRNQSGREDSTSREITVAAPTLSLSIELLGGATPPLPDDAPVDVRVTARASADGVGDLSGLTFDGGVLLSSPGDLFTLVTGPTPEPPGAGFTLSPGASQSFDLRLLPAGVGSYTLSSTLRGVDAADEPVEATATSPGEVGSALEVTLAIDPPFADQPEGDQGPEPVDATLTITVRNTTDTPLTDVNLRSLRVDRTKAGQLLAVEQTGGVSPDPIDGHPLGALGAGESVELTATFRATDDAEVEFSAMATAAAGTANVIGTRTLRWSVKPQYLLAFESHVVHPSGTGLLPAGDPFTIRGTVSNLSNSATLDLGPLFPELAGNAGLMTLTYNALGDPPGTLAVPPKLTLGPGDDMEFNLKVTTGWSDPRGTGDVLPHGGVRAIVTFTPWGTATLEDGTVVDIEPAQIKSTAEDLERTIHIDDSIAIPPFEPLAFGGAVMVGAVEGVTSAVAAIVHGLVDLAQLPAAVLMSTAHYQEQIWNSFTDDEKQAFVDDAGLLIAAVLSRNAEFGKRDATQLYEQVKAVTLQSMTEMANNWEVGDYTQTVEMYTRFGTDAIAQVAVPIALGKLARSPQAVAALERAQQAIQTRMAPVLARLQTVERIEELGPILDALASGTHLTPAEVATLYGITPEELVELQQLATKYKFLLTVRARHVSSIDWIRNFGALLKPEVLKLKSVSEMDVRLGYRPQDLGSLVFKKPAPLAHFDAVGGDYDQIVAQFLQSKGFTPDTPEYLKALSRIEARTKEWRKFEKDYKFWNKRGFIDVSFNYKGNAIDDTVRKGTGQYRGFRLRTIGDEEYVIEFLDNKTGRFVPVTGDIDPIAFTHLDGSPLTMEEHAALIDDMRKNPLLQAQHPESATFVKGGTEFIESQFKPGEPGLQIAPGGLAPRVARFNREQSRWANPRDYHLQWDGGFVHAGASRPPAAVPGAPDLAAAAALPTSAAAQTPALALSGHAGAEGAVMGRCRLTYSTAQEAVPLYVNDQGEIMEVVDGTPVPWAQGPSCFQEGPLVDVAILPTSLVGTGTTTTGTATTGSALTGTATTGTAALGGTIPAGSTRLPLSNDPRLAGIGLDGFDVDQKIIINPGTATAETRTVVGIGSLLLDEPLSFDHEPGEVIVVIEVPDELPRTGGGAGVLVPVGVLVLLLGAALSLLAGRRTLQATGADADGGTRPALR